MRMKLAYQVICATLVVVMAASTTAAPRSIEVRGTRALDENRVRSLLASDGSSPPSPSGLERIHEAYFQAGFLGVRVTSTMNPSDSSWVVDVVEGEPARIGRAHMGGALTRPRDAVMKRLGLLEGAPFWPSQLEARIHELLAEYDDEGLPFAQIWVDSLGYDPEANRVHIKLFVVEGEVRAIQRVDVEGLKKTRPDLAARIAGITPDVPYRAHILRDAYVRLSASGVFSKVEFPAVRMSADGRGVDVVLVVDEPERSHSFTSALGYADREGSEKRQISGLVNLRLNNIGGTLRNLGALWSNDGRERVETKIDYRDQFFLGHRIALGVTLHQIGLDTLYTWQSLGFEIEHPVGRLGGSLIGITAGVHGDRNVFSAGDLKRSWRVRTSLGVRYDRGDIDGAWLSLHGRLTVARKQRVLRSGGDESLNQYIGELETDAVIPLRSILHLRNALVYRGVESDERIVPLPELFYIGGARTLRGYKENQFSGRRVATARTELLLGRTRSENAYLFSDVGYVFRETLTPDGNVDRDELVRAGYGFGLRTRSRLGNVDLSFGVGRKLSLEQTKVHVLLEQRF